MEDKERREKLEKRLDVIEETLRKTEKILMDTNIKLGDMCYDRYGDRLGFGKDGSVTRDGVVIWPERMVD